MRFHTLRISVITISTVEVCVIGVLRHFQHYFSHITTVAACYIRRNSVRVLSSANTDQPCRRHKAHVYHPFTLS